MANPTTNLNITLPVPESESSRGNWGDTINNALQSLDTGIADRGVPSGGADDQVLTKDGTTNYVTKWAPSVKEVNVTGSDGIEVDSGSQITTSGTIALGVNKSTMLTFLNAEDGATADQSATEVRTLVASASDSNVYTDTEKTKLADVNTADLAITAANDANITTVAGDVVDIGTVAGSIGNINLIGDDLASGTFTNIFECGAIDEAVSGTVGTSDVATVAGSIADINRYAAEYIISDDVPTSPTPTAGDLWYDGTNNTLKFHNGTGFVAASEGDISAVTAGTGLSGGGTAGSVTVNIDTGTTVDKTTAQTLSAKTLTSPVLNTGVSGSAILDSDVMSGASATTLSSSESIKAYVDTTVAATNEVVEDTTPQLGGDLDLNNSDITGTGAWLGTTVAVNKGGTGVTTKTGTGNVVLSTSPTLVTPVLGTPASGALTNCTALPAAQVAQGTMASGMVLVAPALGTPASGVATNLTGTASSLTAGSVTTNADLTGDVTSSGNTTAIGLGVIINADVKSDAAISISKTDLAAGTGLSFSSNTLHVDAAQPLITSVGIIGSGTWRGTNIEVDQGGTGATTKTGSGAVVGATSPTLVTPDLGTPSAMMLDFGTI